MKQLNSDITLKTIKCTQHNQNAIKIILEDEFNLQDRVLCKKCIHQGLIKDKKNITIVQAQKQISLKFKDRLEFRRNNYKDLVENMKNLIIFMSEQQNLFQYHFESITNLATKWKTNFLHPKIEKLSIQEQIEWIIRYNQDKKQPELDEVELKLMKPLLDEYKGELYEKLLSLKHLSNNLISTIEYSIEQLNKDEPPLAKKKKINDNINNELNNQFDTICIDLIQQYPNWGKQCHDIQFNQNNDLMAAIYENDIRIYKIEKVQNFDKLILYKILKEHRVEILCLKFSKQNNWLFSGGGVTDHRIILWKENQDQEWEIGQIGEMHNMRITSIIINKVEDQLFSSSDDAKIIVWQINYQQNSITYQYTLNKHLRGIYGMSLNDQETTLISCGLEKCIIIWKRQPNKQWFFFQSINMKEGGLRLSFIGDNQFIQQKQSNGVIQYYEEYDNGKFKQNEKIIFSIPDNQQECKVGFPMQYISNLGLIIIKHHKTVYLVNLNEQKQFIILQSIHLDSEWISGNISNEGTKLCLSDCTSQQLYYYDIQYLQKQ